MRVFTQHDVANSICTHDEVGQPWEDRYSIDDHFKNQCTMDQVGSAKPVVPSTKREAPSTTQNLNVREVVQRALNLMGEDDQLSAYLAERHDIMAPLVAKLGLSDITKEQEPPVDFEKIPDEDLLAMTSADLKRILLQSGGITKKSQLTGEN